MTTGRYRVVINGFTVQSETWDDALNRDGKHDEVYASAQVAAYDRNGGLLYKSSPKSPTMGDIWQQNGRVQAGSASDRGGLVTGDRFPTQTPWIRTIPLRLERDWPPFTIWEGDLTDGENLVTIAPGINEFDPGSDAMQGWLKWGSDAIGKLGPQIAGLLAGGVGQVVFSAFQLGLDIVASMDRAGVLGRAQDRPIGMTDDGNGRLHFVPQVIVLDRARAEYIIAQQPAGKGAGVLELEFKDDPVLRGHYILYLQVERVDGPAQTGGWSHWEPHASWCQYGTPATSWAANRLDVFTVGIDNALYHKYWDGGQWHAFERLGGSYLGAPAVVSRAPDRLDIFAINSADRAVHHFAWDGNGWTQPDSLGGVFGYGVTAASRSADRLDVFAIGADQTLQHKWWDGAWSDWHSLGNGFRDVPAAVSWGPDRVDVFAIGQDHATRHRFWNGQDWTDWESLGGWCRHGLAVTSRGPDNLELFTIGIDGDLFQKRWDGNQWSPWIGHGGRWVGAPGVDSWAPDRLDVFVIGTDRELYHRWKNG